ncbi:hypothetical protein J6590_080157 [Homalodisca vitripennis]|nr:hypothetical protein J6590_080157 [Homalodisca vitripennis]
MVRASDAWSKQAFILFALAPPNPLLGTRGGYSSTPMGEGKTDQRSISSLLQNINPP